MFKNIKFKNLITYCNIFLVILIILFILLLVFRPRKFHFDYNNINNTINNNLNNLNNNNEEYIHERDNIALNKLQLQEGRTIEYDPNNYFKNIENFQTMEDSGVENISVNDVKIPYDFDKIEIGTFPETVYERSIKKVFKDDIIMKCSLIPTEKSNNCLINGLPLIKYKYPVSLLKSIDGTILSVFNDGRVYYKKSVLDNLWSGPIKNSFPNRKIPLRCITLSPNGQTLYGVGYDNNVYAKHNIFKDGSLFLDGDWVPIYGLENVIHLMFYHEKTSNQYKFLIIDINGKLKITNTDNPKSGLVDISIINTPILKAFYDLDNYLCVIDTDFRIQSFDDKNWINSKLSTKFNPSLDRVLDVLYDNDKMLFGLVLDNKNKTTDLRKQEEYGHNTKFVEFKYHKSLDSSLNKLIPDLVILKSKIGEFKFVEEEQDFIDNDINLAYHRQMLKDKQKLRDFCKSQNYKSTKNMKDYNLEKYIQQNNTKIEKIKEFLNTLTIYDSTYKSLVNNTDDSDIKTSTL